MSKRQRLTEMATYRSTLWRKVAENIASESQIDGNDSKIIGIKHESQKVLCCTGIERRSEHPPRQSQLDPVENPPENDLITGDSVPELLLNLRTTAFDRPRR